MVGLNDVVLRIITQTDGTEQLVTTADELRLMTTEANRAAKAFVALEAAQRQALLSAQGTYGAATKAWKAAGSPSKGPVYSAMDDASSAAASAQARYNAVVAEGNTKVTQLTGRVRELSAAKKDEAISAREEARYLSSLGSTLDSMVKKYAGVTYAHEQYRKQMDAVSLGVERGRITQEQALAIQDKITASWQRQQGVIGTVTRAWNKYGTTAFEVLGSLSFGIVVAERLYRGFKDFANFIGGFIKASIDATEAENLINVAFGKSADSIRAWSQQLSAHSGLDDLKLRQQAGTWDLIMTSTGMAADKAEKYSKILTMLAVDIASLRNLSLDDTTEKMRSGLAGHVESLRAIGISVDNNTVKAYAFTHGIGAAGKELTAVEKQEARIGVMIESASKDVGDFGRTWSQPANQVRAIGEQLGIVKRHVGDWLRDTFNLDNALLSITGTLMSITNAPAPGQETFWGVIGEVIKGAGRAAGALATGLANTAMVLRGAGQTALTLDTGFLTGAIRDVEAKTEGNSSGNTALIERARKEFQDRLAKEMTPGDIMPKDWDEAKHAAYQKDLVDTYAAMDEHKLAMAGLEKTSAEYRDELRGMIQDEEHLAQVQGVLRPAAARQTMIAVAAQKKQIQDLTKQDFSRALSATMESLSDGMTQAKDHKGNLVGVAEQIDRIRAAYNSVIETAYNAAGGDAGGDYAKIEADHAKVRLDKDMDELFDILEKAYTDNMAKETNRWNTFVSNFDWSLLSVPAYFSSSLTLEGQNPGALFSTSLGLGGANRGDPSDPLGLQGGKASANGWLDGFTLTLKSTDKLNDAGKDIANKFGKDLLKYGDTVAVKMVEPVKKSWSELWNELGGDIQKSWSKMFENGIAAMFKGGKFKDLLTEGLQTFGAAASGVLSGFLLDGIFGKAKEYTKDGKLVFGSGKGGLLGSYGFGDLWQKGFGVDAPLGTVGGGVGTGQALAVGGSMLWGYGAATQNRTVAAIGGAATGAATGAMMASVFAGAKAGSTMGIIGAVIGAVVGAAMAYFSAGPNSHAYGVSWSNQIGRFNSVTMGGTSDKEHEAALDKMQAKYNSTVDDIQGLFLLMRLVAPKPGTVNISQTGSTGDFTPVFDQILNTDLPRDVMKTFYESMFGKLTRVDGKNYSQLDNTGALAGIGVSSDTRMAWETKFSSGDYDSVMKSFKSYITTLVGMLDFTKKIGSAGELTDNIMAGPMESWRKAAKDTAEQLGLITESFDNLADDSKITQAQKALDLATQQLDANTAMLKQIEQVRRGYEDSIGSILDSEKLNRAKDGGVFPLMDALSTRFNDAIGGISGATDLDSLDKAEKKAEQWAQQLLSLADQMQQVSDQLKVLRDQFTDLGEAIGKTVTERFATLNQSITDTFVTSMGDAITDVDKYRQGLNDLDPATAEYTDRLNKIATAAQNGNQALDQYVQALYQMQKAADAGWQSLQDEWGLGEAKKGGAGSEGQWYADQILAAQKTISDPNSTAEQVQAAWDNALKYASSMYGMGDTIQVNKDGQMMSGLEWLQPFMTALKGVFDQRVNGFGDEAEGWRAKLGKSLDGLAGDIDIKKTALDTAIDAIRTTVETKLGGALTDIEAKLTLWKTEIEGQNLLLKTTIDGLTLELQNLNDVIHNTTTTFGGDKNGRTGDGGRDPVVDVPQNAAATFTSAINEAAAAATALKAVVASIGGSVAVTVNLPEGASATVDGREDIVKILRRNPALLGGVLG